MATLWKRENRWVLAVTAISFVLGGLLAVQVHSKQVRGATQVGRQTSALVGMLTNTQAQLQKQKEETERLQARLAQYETEAVSETGMVKLMAEQLNSSRVALGLLPVKGPGVQLELDDSTMRAGNDFGGQDLYVVHDYDLVQISNELRAAGAEAISLNGQRLVSGSAIICSARLIKVNDETISPPFTFLAIGNKDNLMSALNIRDGVLDRLRVMQFKVKLTPKEELVIPPIAIAPSYKFAKPVIEEAKP
jgi:uncharacterized protein YlxW (UPF0749 family)